MNINCNTDKHMTKEESYVQRRQLFKNIWETAMHIDEKEDIMNKPKVIKTLRMDEIDKCPVGKTKKQRIKNLRHVCNRILDFCDRQDADDQFYEQVAGTEGSASPTKTGVHVPRKLKSRAKKKVKLTKSMFVSQNNVRVARVATSERQQNSSGVPLNKRKSLFRKSALTKTKTVSREKKGVTISPSDDIPREATTTKRKVVKKKRGKKKKSTTVKTGSPHIINV